MTQINRRRMLQTLGAASAAAAFGLTTGEVVQAAQMTHAAREGAAAAKQPYTRRFFTAHEFATIVALSDLIIPKDARSGSASDVGAPEFIDYIVAAQADRQTAMRGGLTWLDTDCRRRFNKRFLACTAAERRQVLDDIAWPRRAAPAMSHGVRFFSTLRDLVATGFWSSKAGMADIGYSGNVANFTWQGAPAHVLQKLGVG